MSIDPQVLDSLGAEADAEVADLARRAHRAGGPVLKVLNRIGGSVEDQLKHLPEPVRSSLLQLATSLLEQVYGATVRIGRIERLRPVGPRFHRIAAMASGAMGGAGGLGTAVVELPATIGLIFGAMQKAAAAEGFDPNSEEVRLICLEILGSGGPQPEDDGIDTTFLGARLGMSGAALHGIIARLAPRFATFLGQKLAGQAVPIIGAVAGAGVNLVFLEYFQEMARVRFALRRLALQHGEEPVRTAFKADMAQLARPRRAAA